MSDRSVVRHIKTLVERGWLARGSRMIEDENGNLVPWRSGKGWRRNQYSGLIPDVADTVSPACDEKEPIDQLGADKGSEVGADTDSSKHIHFLSDGFAGKGVGKSDDEWLADFEKAEAGGRPKRWWTIREESSQKQT